MNKLPSKKCFKCGEIKVLSSFYKHQKMTDGHVNKCKECNKKDVRENYSAKIDKYKKYEKERALLPHRIKAREEYSKTDAYKESHKKSMHKYNMTYPFKYMAKNKVSNAVRDGKLVKPNQCSNCGKEGNTHAHHDDYSKPLDVRWLCVSCHSRWHRNNKALYPYDV